MMEIDSPLLLVSMLNAEGRILVTGEAHFVLVERRGWFYLMGTPDSEELHHSLSQHATQLAISAHQRIPISNVRKCKRSASRPCYNFDIPDHLKMRGAKK